MNYKRIWVMVVTFITLMSCADNSVTTDVVRNRIKPDTSGSDTIIVNVEDTSAYAFMDFVDSVRFIRLETSVECQIGHIDEVLFSDSVIVVVDKLNAKSVLLFNHDGKFISRVSGQGNGPREYLSLGPAHVALYYDGSMLAIQDNQKNKCLWYDMAGHYLRTTDMTFRLGNWESVSENRFLHYADYRSGSENAVFVMTDSADVCTFSMEDSKNSIPKMVSSTIYRQGSRTIGHHLTENTVYQFDSGLPEAVCHITIMPDDIRNHKYRTVDAYFKNKRELPHLASNILVSDNAICFEVGVGRSFNQYIYFRNEHELYRIAYAYDNIHSCAFHSYITCLDDNWIVCYLEPSEISYFIDHYQNSGIVDSWLSAMGQSPDRDDNPILVLYHLKNRH